mgnify:FL=1
MTIRVVIIFVAIIAAFVLVGCEEELTTTSRTERVQQFESDLNNDRSNAYTNIHPDATSRDLFRNPAQWDTAGFDAGPYSFNIGGQSGNDVTGTIDAPNDVGFDTATFRFTMKEDGEDNWKILRLEIPDGGSLVIQQRLDSTIIWP